MSSLDRRFPLHLLVVLLGFSAITFGQTAAVSQEGTTLDSITNAEAVRDGLHIRTSSATMQVTALRDDIIRVRIAPAANLREDASWAVLAEARNKTIDVKPTQDASYAGFRTATLDVRVERSPLRLVIRDLAGNTISADAVGRPVTFQSSEFTLSKEMPGGEHYFGLGDKTGAFDRREQVFTLWNTDVGPQESVDPLYKAIPFFLAINGTRSYRDISRQYLAHLVRLWQVCPRCLFVWGRGRPPRLLLHLRTDPEAGRGKLSRI